MSTIQEQEQIPNIQIGSNQTAEIHGVARQTVDRWFSTGLFETATLERTPGGMRYWVVDLREVLLFTRPGLGCRSKVERAEFTAPSLTEDEIRAWVAKKGV